MQTGINLLRHFLADESGATAIEYALIATLIGVVIIVGVTASVILLKFWRRMPMWLPG